MSDSSPHSATAYHLGRAAGMLKQAAGADKHVFMHTTSEENLRKILEGKRISALRHIARRTPDLPVSVESGLTGLSDREVLRAAAAYERMRATKDVDSLFLTRDGWLPHYGDHVLVKRLSSPKRRNAFNLVPNEYTIKRELSPVSRAEIYVPADKLEEWKTQHPKANVRPLEDIPGIRLSRLDGALQLPAKALRRLTKASSFDPATLTDAQARKLFGRNAFLAGSEPLGIAVSSSDVDVFVPYTSEHHFNRAKDRIRKRYPMLQERPWEGDRPKVVFTGDVNGTDVDVVLGHGEKARNFVKAFQEARGKLTPEEQERVRREKLRLKAAWFLKEYRYKRYKKQLAQDLGLEQHYF